jgi:hypothetical protein
LLVLEVLNNVISSLKLATPVIEFDLKASEEIFRCHLVLTNLNCGKEVV